VQQKLFVAAADPVEEKILHMVTADPARTPTFSPFAQGDYFLSAAPGTPATCTNNDPNQCLTTAVTNPNSSFAWNHGGLQPEIRNTWIGWVGPGIATKGQTDRVWTDHTDIRPTMLSLLGLKDDYVSDGRVVNEFLKGANGNDNAQGNDDDQGDEGSQSAHKLDALGALYKQLNASFGDFSMNTLCASTAALGSTSAGDTTYSSIENALQSLGAQRDTLANAIRAALWNAEFNGQKLDQKQVKDWIKQGQSYLDQAAALCSQFQSGSNAKELGKLKHIVVIYEENHSFDNLFGGWEGVNGLNNVHQSGVGDHVTQVDQNGVPFGCLQQLDVNLSTNPQYAGLPVTCTDALHNIQSHFPNGYFSIDGFIAPSDITCPPITNAFGFANGILKQGLDPNTHNPVPGARAGGCTRDLVHEFYQEQYQIHGGAQDRYMSGSDSVGTSMGVYDTKQLPVYKYLHSKGAPHYAIDDNFFQSAFGGSFLNHQWLIAAASPVDPTGVPGGAHAGSHSIIDSNGMPVAYPQYTPTGPVQRNPLTVSCPATPPAAVCGNWAVNTMQPAVNPQGAFSQILPLQTGTTIGDRLTAAGVDWAWYSGGWANANGDLTDPGYTNQKTPAATPSGCSDPNVDTGVRAGVPVAAWPRCPDALFQYHHQPFNYYANYAPGTPGRAHLQDEVDFEKLAQSSDKHACNLKPVSFIKPIGEENEHPGYASQPNGNDHLVELLQMIEQTGCKKDTMVVVTYDEFGGQWDHVSPPGQGNNNGPHDVWGPGTRIPALILSPHIKGRFVVDSAEHDTTSILATIEHRYGLAPLSSRDAAVNDLATVYSAKKPHDH
jgi:phospholipase C